MNAFEDLILRWVSLFEIDLLSNFYKNILESTVGMYVIRCDIAPDQLK